ncbi:hypothetical protein CY34DRAFT_682201 [Suillus luteus UH-Slu-Lm8-n1]|uniref:Uncharacterized protein n=1 Tax=Suillus luteus UH-Slu-Lm8-n1 TaxID=930992 RepID=A0A0D0APS3_9AGAM|nr:hypothetical protein CY34DRAFT_682201 [Suillus luteus UH-Slu-Lm8-n1]
MCKTATFSGRSPGVSDSMYSQGVTTRYRQEKVVSQIHDSGSPCSRGQCPLFSSYILLVCVPQILMLCQCGVPPGDRATRNGIQKFKSSASAS